MSSRAPELCRRWLRWLVPGAVAALAPKCALCAAAYLGLGSMLGWTTVEICGAPDDGVTHGLAWLVPAAAMLGVGARAVTRWTLRR